MTAGRDMTRQGSYELDFRVRNPDLGDPHRVVDVQSSPQEIERFARDGFFVRERLFEGHELARLRAALDEVVGSEPSPSGGTPIEASRRYGGVYLSHLMDKHRTFLELVRCEPIVSVVRAVLGPQVQVRGVSARITYPDQSNQETHWHFHQRIVPDPLPPFFSPPQIVDALIYLDEVDDANGPLSVVPGSHRWTEKDLRSEDYDDKPGQQVLRLPPGSCVMIHGSLWHRALPTRPDGTVRRLLIMGFGPIWMRRWSRHEPPPSPLIAELLADADQETCELLGVRGPM